jgi:hypothetical protein
MPSACNTYLVNFSRTSDICPVTLLLFIPKAFVDILGAILMDDTVFGNEMKRELPCL